MKNKLALFDFDGTLTKKDSFVSFFSFVNGRRSFLIKSLPLIPSILGYYLKIVSGHQLKERYLRRLVVNKTVEEFRLHSKKYAEEVAPGIMNETILQALLEFQKQNFRCIVVSASMDIWLDEWAEKNNVEVICTKSEIQDNKYTGRLSTPDCVKGEKVKRIQAHLQLSDYSEIAVYGNAPDAEMLKLATSDALRVLI